MYVHSAYMASSAQHAGETDFTPKLEISQYVIMGTSCNCSVPPLPVISSVRRSCRHCNHTMPSRWEFRSQASDPLGQHIQHPAGDPRHCSAGGKESFEPQWSRTSLKANLYHRVFNLWQTDAMPWRSSLGRQCPTPASSFVCDRRRHGQQLKCTSFIAKNMVKFQMCSSAGKFLFFT